MQLWELKIITKLGNCRMKIAGSLCTGWIRKNGSLKNVTQFSTDLLLLTNNTIISLRMCWVLFLTPRRPFSLILNNDEILPYYYTLTANISPQRLFIYFWRYRLWSITCKWKKHVRSGRKKPLLNRSKSVHLETDKIIWFLKFWKFNLIFIRFQAKFSFYF